MLTNSNIIETNALCPWEMPKITAKEKHFFRRHYGHFKTAQGICCYNFWVCEHFLMGIKKNNEKKSKIEPDMLIIFHRKFNSTFPYLRKYNYTFLYIWKILLCISIPTENTTTYAYLRKIMDFKTPYLAQFLTFFSHFF